MEAGNEYLRIKDGPAGIRPKDDAGAISEVEEPATPIQQVQVPPSSQPLVQTQMSTPSPDPMAMLSTAMAQLAKVMEAIQTMLAGQREVRKKVCWQCGREGHMQDNVKRRSQRPPLRETATASRSCPYC